MPRKIDETKTFIKGSTDYFLEIFTWSIALVLSYFIIDYIQTFIPSDSSYYQLLVILILSSMFLLVMYIVRRRAKNKVKEE